MAGKNLKERYVAAMVLSGVGDALGYKNGSWEFCYSGETIHKQAKKLGGVGKIEVKLPEWRVSDDTVLHLATAEALAKHTSGEDKDTLYRRFAAYYKEGMEDMDGRGPGPTTISACRRLRPRDYEGYIIPFNPRGGGCGAAMRSMCIGLRFPQPDNIGDLIAVSIESGRMTHHHPTGYLGSLTSALFVSYAIQSKPIHTWGYSLVNDVLPKAKQFVENAGHDVKNNLKTWDFFTSKWESYLGLRNIIDGTTQPKFPKKYGVIERDEFYKSLSYDGWGGASGHDAPMIAYDALLSSKGDWKELCSRAMFHYGDSDSTGVIAACWFGAMHGFQGVPECNYKKVEYYERLETSATDIFTVSHLESENSSHSDTQNDGPSTSNVSQDPKEGMDTTNMNNDGHVKSQLIETPITEGNMDHDQGLGGYEKKNQDRNVVKDKTQECLEKFKTGPSDTLSRNQGGHSKDDHIADKGKDCSSESCNSTEGLIVLETQEGNTKDTHESMLRNETGLEGIRDEDKVSNPEVEKEKDLRDSQVTNTEDEVEAKCENTDSEPKYKKEKLYTEIW